jgi:hypothetical protein
MNRRRVLTLVLSRVALVVIAGTTVVTCGATSPRPTVDPMTPVAGSLASR